MPNYQNGKVYSIRSHSRPDLVYVGSTTQPLSKRFGGHKELKNKNYISIVILIKLKNIISNTISKNKHVENDATNNVFV